MNDKLLLREHLATRRSVPLKFLTNPGPNKEQLEEIFSLAIRVPDHGKLAPWRMIVYQGEARAKIGENLANIASAKFPDFDETRRTIEKNQLLPAPVTVGVLSSPVEHFKIPQFEQLLSAGNVAFNLAHAANALGFGTHWVTRWFAYDDAATTMLGAKTGEKFVGFVHIGTAKSRIEERARPKLTDIVSEWNG